MIYDSGFALQSKAVLVESTTTVAEVVQQVTQALNLIGGANGYALEERDILAGSECGYIHTRRQIIVMFYCLASRLLSLTEIPLQRKLSYGSQDAYMEFRLMELQTNTVGVVRGFCSMSSPMQRRSVLRSDSDDSLEDNSNIVPKEEGILLQYYPEV